ncbi:MAG TPA: class I SAM-dependent methyltransferase [Chitinophagaceae bacterium]|nr:class I SAM-dependent methyltransferase [Chitinophagaceae bacterium]
MYSNFQLGRKYLQYFLTASNGKGHGIHSPFVFDFVKNILNDRRDFYAFTPIENLRKELLIDKTLIDVNDLGAGSSSKKNNQRTIAEIAKKSLKPKKLGQLLFRIVDHFRPKTIVELGTSLGITTAYLAAANGAGKVFTIEGADRVADVAQKNFDRLNLYNTTLIRGNFDEKLRPVLNELLDIDLAFVDGNHRLEPTLKYFDLLLRYSNENTILIFDDIHWSREMEVAWEQIKKADAVTCTVDLFFLGFVFFRKEFKERQHFAVRF